MTACLCPVLAPMPSDLSAGTAEFCAAATAVVHGGGSGPAGLLQQHAAGSQRETSRTSATASTAASALADLGSKPQQLSPEPLRQHARRLQLQPGSLPAVGRRDTQLQ